MNRKILFANAFFQICMIKIISKQSPKANFEVKMHDVVPSVIQILTVQVDAYSPITENKTLVSIANKKCVYNDCE